MLDRVVVINDRSQSVGGASGLAILSAELLAAKGVPVTFFAGDDGQDSPLTEADVEVVSLAGRPLLEQSRISAFATGLYNPATARKLRAWIQERDTDGTIYHVHGWSKILSPSLFLALKPVAARVILHGHDFFLACPNGAYTNFPANQVCALRPLSTKCLKTQCDKNNYAQKLWRVTRHVLSNRFHNLGSGSGNVVVIHPAMVEPYVRAGIDPQQIQVLRNPSEPFCADGVNAGANRSFFFIGRLEQEKGFADAADAARRANVPLEFIGDGLGRALLERDYPEFPVHGWKKRDEIGILVKRARAVIVSSKWPEPFGLVIIEALSSGIPVIIADHALLAQEVVENKMGLSYKANDVPALAEVLRRVAVDDTSVSTMSHRARKRGGKLGNTQAMWRDLLLELYKEKLRYSKLTHHGKYPLEEAKLGQSGIAL